MKKYSLATTTWDNKEIEAIHRVIDSDFYSMGKEVKAFEEEFAKLFGSKYAIMVNSGSSANLVAMTALTSHKLGNRKLKEGDEVITVAAGFPTTVAPIIQNGLVPVFIDINLENYDFDEQAIERAGTKSGNKGYDAAVSAIEMVNLLKSI